MGHALCTAIAVIGGKIVAQRISVRTGDVLNRDDCSTVKRDVAIETIKYYCSTVGTGELLQL